jgi:uncharacterized membrane protein YphA (DoxX/SURF4 family)
LTVGSELTTMLRTILDQFSKFFVGGLFIFSGLIKLNDPIGTEIKMHEYFEVFAADFGSFFNIFVPYALEIGFIMVVLEIALGVAVLINYKMNITTKVLLALLVFFTFLTFYSAYFNKVTDCGCFGDAIKLTPWQSFFKDIILMVFVLHLVWHHKRYVPVLRTREGHAVVGVATALSIFLGVYAIRHLPFLDFRAYKIGNNIPAQMKPQEQPIIEYVFEKDGKEITSPTYLMEAGYTYKSSRVVNEDKVVAKIIDFSVSTPEGEDITQQMFTGAKLLIVMYDIKKTSAANIEEIRSLTKALEGKIEMIILTASPAEEVEAFRHQHQLAVPYAFTDATVLKTIVRANPGLTLWVNGTVKGMWHHNDTPDVVEVLELIVD